MVYLLVTISALLFLALLWFIGKILNLNEEIEMREQELLHITKQVRDKALRDMTGTTVPKSSVPAGKSVLYTRSAPQGSVEVLDMLYIPECRAEYRKLEASDCKNTTATQSSSRKSKVKK